MAEKPLPRISTISNSPIGGLNIINERRRSMQVAIVSSDASNVDQHFGKAGRFLIYEINGDNQALVGIKVVTPISEGDKGHEFNRKKFSAVASQLNGCERLYCTRIGDRPATELKELGIEPVIYQGPISEIVL
jgi:predicted Fe-Mo cluster-binding NifX family protein